MADGGTVGQASGPLLTFDDTNNYLEVTGCDVGIGTTTPNSKLQVANLINFDDTNYNVLLGTNAGSALTDGTMNVMIGHNAGLNKTITGLNIIIGKAAGEANGGDCNVFIGKAAGQLATSDNNVFIGSDAGSKVVGGGSNFALGRNAMLENVSGTDNIYIGYSAGRDVTGGGNILIGSAAGRIGTSASHNTMIGKSVSRYNQTGDENVLIGYEAGYGSSGNSYSKNTFIGYQSGYPIETGSGNVFIGYKSGYNQTTNSNLLIIDNQDRTSAALDLANSLIYGVFDVASANQSFRINAYLKVKEAIMGIERSTDPTEPSEGEFVIWMSDGTGFGDDGDVCAASQAAGTTKKVIIFDHSAGAAW